MDKRFVKLNDVAEVITGIAADNTDGRYSYFYYQPNNFIESGEVTDLTVVKRNELVQERQLIKMGDILVKRLNPNYPLLISELPGDSIVSPNLYIVRGGPGIIPEYLAFLFEQSSVLSQITQLSGANAAIKAISAKKLVDISIPLIPTEKQVLIGKWWTLAKRRKKLLMEYISETDKLTTTMAERIFL
jgi:hypothetical protein